jgi:type II secretory pathway pseudopilin PulG
MRGMTLLELLVATSIFTMIGGILVTTLHRAVRSWRKGEARRESYEEAQAVLRQIRQDLRHAFTATPAIERDEVRTRFIADTDPFGRQRMTLIRTLPAESRHPVATLAGTELGAREYLDGHRDWSEGRAGELRATEGLFEVVYAMDPRGDSVLLRGTRSPPGGRGSLFDVAVIDDPELLREVALPLSSKVLYFGLRFWTQYTERWDGPAPVVGALPGDGYGPIREWDSTRGLLEPPPELEDRFHPFRSAGAELNPDDDIVPMRVLVTLVVTEDAPAGPRAFLEEALTPSSDVIVVDDARLLEERLPWVRIEKEWIRCELDTPKRLRVLERGGRGTVAEAHEGSEEVLTGRTFLSVIEIPSAREAWDE